MAEESINMTVFVHVIKQKSCQDNYKNGNTNGTLKIVNLKYDGNNSDNNNK